jgi:hypothetical protein
VSLLLGLVIYAHIFQKDRLSNAPDIGPKSAEAFWRAHRQVRKEQIVKAGIKSAPARK